MASSIFNDDNVNEDIKFINNHIGGNNDEDQEIFKKQVKLNDFIDESRDTFKPIKNKVNNQKRLNNVNTEINKISISNDLVIPDNFKYDNFFQYLLQKNLNTINSRTVLTHNQVNIDSRLQNRETFNEYINLLFLKITFQGYKEVLHLFL